VHGHHRGEREENRHIRGGEEQEREEYTEEVPSRSPRVTSPPASAESSITMNDLPQQEPLRQQLGGGWEKIDEGDTTFYFNASTNEVRTSPPRL